MAYCRYCGDELEENARFCGNCGRAVDDLSQNEKKSKATEPGNFSKKSTSDNRAEDSKATSLNNKFSRDFVKIAAGEKPKFSIFSLIFGPFQQVYHKSYDTFAKSYLPVIVLMIIDTGISAYAGLALDMTMLAVASVINIVGLVWGFIVAIRNGKNYAGILYKQTGGNPSEIKTSIVSVILLCVLLVVGVLISNEIGYSLGMSQREQEFQDIDVYASSEQVEQLDDCAEQQGDLDTTISSNGITLMPTEYVIVASAMPWTGVWQIEEGNFFSADEYLKYHIVQTALSSDGYYEIDLYDQYDNTLSEIWICALDGSTLDEYDAEGNYISTYYRPGERVDIPLPQEWWGMYTLSELTDETYSAEDAIIIDAYRFGSYPYLNVESLVNDTYRCYLNAAPEGWNVMAKYDAINQTITLLNDLGKGYAMYTKIA